MPPKQVDKTPTKQVKPSAQTAGTSSSLSPDTKTTGAKVAEPNHPPTEKVCDVGASFNEIQFPSPLYASAWVDNSHFVVGGGGGARFGYANTLALIHVSPLSKTAAPKKKDEQPSPPWVTVDSVDFNDGIVWELSNVVPFGKSTTTRSTLAAVSHVDSFSVVEFQRSANKSALKHVCRVSLVHDEENPDKKPICIANNTVFVCQDNKSIALFDVEALHSRAQELWKKTIDEAPVFPLAKKEGSTVEEKKWRKLVIGGGCSEEKEKDPNTTVFGDRISGIDAWAVDEKTTVLVATCHDKKFRAFLLKKKESSGDEEAAASSADWEIVSKVEVDGRKDGLNLPFQLLKSSLRFAKFGKHKDGKAQVLIVAYCARTGFSHIVNGRLSVGDGEGAAKKAATLKFTVVADPKEGVVEDAITCLSPGGLTTTSYLCSTTDGAVAELQCPVGEKVSLLRLRKGVHREPISSICMQPVPAATSSSGESSAKPQPPEASGAAVITTDIAQRVLISKMATTLEAVGEKNRVQAGMLLFPYVVDKKKQRMQRILLFIFLLILGMVGALFAPQVMEMLEHGAK